MALISAPVEIDIYRSSEPDYADPMGQSLFADGLPGAGGVPGRSPSGHYGMGVGGHSYGPVSGSGFVSQSTKETSGRLTHDLMNDYGLSREQALGIVGNLGHESSDFHQMQEGGQPMGQGGWGYAQWTGPRRKEFFDVTAGMDPTSYEANYKMLRHDLSGNYKGSIAAIKRTSDIEGATESFEQTYERAGVVAMESRISRAMRYGKYIDNGRDAKQRYHDAAVKAANESTPSLGTE